MKITVYTVNDCQFSKQEKDYLVSKGLQYEEKNLETNPKFLTEMLAVSNNFAGTPVTEIKKDDGQTVVLKGFTKEDFEKELTAVSAAAPSAAIPAVEMSTPAAPSVSAEPVQPPAPSPAPAPEPTPIVEPPPAAIPETPVVQPTPVIEEPVKPVETPVSAQPAVVGFMSAAPEPPPVQPPAPAPAPTVEPTPAPEPPIAEPPAPAPTIPPNPQEANPALSSILEQLQSKATDTQAQPQAQQTAPQAFN